MDEQQKIRWRSVNAERATAAAIDAGDRARAQLALAQEALKALLLANGGALVALFTFIGNALAKGSALRLGVPSLHTAFASFAIGFALTLLGYVMAFLSQDRFYHQAEAELARFHRGAIEDAPQPDQSIERRLNGQGLRWYVIGICLALAAVGAFVTGCWCALRGVALG